MILQNRRLGEKEVTLSHKFVAKIFSTPRDHNLLYYTVIKCIFIQCYTNNTIQTIRKEITDIEYGSIIRSKNLNEKKIRFIRKILFINRRFVFFFLS